MAGAGALLGHFWRQGAGAGRGLRRPLCLRHRRMHALRSSRRPIPNLAISRRRCAFVARSALALKASALGVLAGAVGDVFPDHRPRGQGRSRCWRRRCRSHRAASTPTAQAPAAPAPAAAPAVPTPAVAKPAPPARTPAKPSRRGGDATLRPDRCRSSPETIALPAAAPRELELRGSAVAGDFGRPRRPRCRRRRQRSRRRRARWPPMPAPAPARCGQAASKPKKKIVREPQPERERAFRSARSPNRRRGGSACRSSASAGSAARLLHSVAAEGLRRRIADAL